LTYIGFLLLGMLSLSLVYVFKHHLAHLPQIQETMVRSLLIPLAIADVSWFHAYVSLLYSVW
jgi:hypothetical protein